MLSGISSSQVTKIGVICLPLYDAEVQRFLDLAFAWGRPTRRVTNSTARTIRNHLDDLRQELENTAISAGPMGDDMVCFSRSAIIRELKLVTVSLAGHDHGTGMVGPHCHVSSTDLHSATPLMKGVFSSS